MMGKMGTFDSKSEWDKVLAVIPDDITRKELDKEWTTNASLSSSQKWDMLQAKVRLNRKKNGMANVSQDIIFQYSYPRLDSHVSMGLNHLLKAPFCVHPKTGRVCIPIDPLLCDDFDPMLVPKLEDLAREMAKGKGYPILVTELASSLQPHLDHFKKFCKSLEESNGSIKLKREDAEKTLSF